MKKRALIAGAGLEGVRLALELAGKGVQVTLVEDTATLQAGRPDEDVNLLKALPRVPELLKAASHKNISILTGSAVEKVEAGHGQFKVTVNRSPRYVSVENCASCGRCEQACPVHITTRAGGSSNGNKAIHRPGLGIKSVPSAYTIDKKGKPPCTTACPAGINAHGYIALISKGKFAEALDLVTDAVAFPRVLGRVCSHPCQSQCTRGKIDQPIAICALKRFVGDVSSAESSLLRAQTSKNGVKVTGQPRVAIVGAGPAGLTAARDLARFGHRATVFEALPVPGGMITVGMPRFRLPREVRQADINSIERLGIEIRTSTPIGKDLTLKDLRGQGYEAILIATGAHKNQKLGIPGETLSGVIDSIALLQALNLKQPISVGKKVVVIGGGYTAIDSARTAVRLHCDSVNLLYRRSQEEMPANAEEVAEAKDEGVNIQYLVAPIRIIGHEGKVTGVECIRMRLGEPDHSGRRRPITVGGSEFTVAADTVIVAVGQRPDLSFIDSDLNLTDGRKHVIIDPVTMATKVPGIFAAGDAAGEPGTMVEAIAAGRRAAISIDRYLRGQKTTKEDFPARPEPIKVDLADVYVPPIEQQAMPCLPKKARLGNFEEVDLGFTAKMAVREAQRCLNCAGCSECLECERACQLQAIEHSAVAERLEFLADAVITGANSFSNPGIYHITPSQAETVARDILDKLGAGKAIPPEPHPDPDVALHLNGAKRRLGIFVCECGGGISNILDVPDLVSYGKSLPGVIFSHAVGYACTREGTTLVQRAARRYKLTDIILAACTCCSLDQVCFSCSDRRIQCKAGLLNGGGNGARYEFVNIREHCAWVHSDDPEATAAKARSLIGAGVARAMAKESVNRSTTPTVALDRCRGCGTCVAACRFEAIKLEQGREGVLTARVDQALCQGCGACAAVCPSGALSQADASDAELMASVGAMLARCSS